MKVGTFCHFVFLVLKMRREVVKADKQKGQTFPHQREKIVRQQRLELYMSSATAFTALTWEIAYTTRLIILQVSICFVYVYYCIPSLWRYIHSVVLNHNSMERKQNTSREFYKTGIQWERKDENISCCYTF